MTPPLKLFLLVSCSVVSLGSQAADQAMETAQLEIQTIRNLSSALMSESFSDLNGFVRFYQGELFQPVKSFDPEYDPDIELDFRRRNIQEELKGKGAPKVYVPWSEVSKWAPTNDCQVSLRQLSLITAKRIDQLASGNLETSFATVEALNVNPAFKRSIRADVYWLKFKDYWMIDMGQMDRVVAAHKRFLESVHNHLEQQALAARMVRRATNLKTDWTRYRDRPGSNPWFESSRRQLVLDSATISDYSRRILVSWMRIAALAHNYNRLAEETKNVLVETNRVLDENGMTVKSERVPYYAIVFSNMQQLLALAFVNDGILGMEGESFEIIEPFARESALLLGIVSPSGYESFLRTIDGSLSVDNRYPDRMKEYLEREKRRNGVINVTPIETPPDGWFEPYNSRGSLPEFLSRSCFEVGSFVQPAFKYDGETNRASYLLFTPKNVSEKIPLLLFLPGVGEIGGDLAKLLRQRTIIDIVTSDAFQKKHPCFFLAISPPEETETLSGDEIDGEPTPIQRTIHDALVGIARTRKRPAVDDSRIYITGLSFGGSGAYALPLVYPDTFAASVPVSACVIPSELPNPPYACNFFHLWNEGEARNNQTDANLLDSFGNITRDAGYDFRVGTFPNEGHNAWDAAWRDEAVWDWMFSKRRGANGTTTAAPGRIPDPTRRGGGEGETHAENAESAENAAPKPPAVTASKPGRDARTGPERALDGLDGTAYVSASPVAAGDWVQVEWSAPVQGRIEVRTGLSDGTLRLSKGRVEVSVDGRVWSRTGTVSQKTGVCAFQQRTGIRFLRLLPEPRLPEPLAVREIAVKP